MNRIKLIYSSSISAIFTIIFVLVVTIAADEHAPFKDYLKSWTGHHWTTKSIATVLVYSIFVLLVYVTTREPKANWVRGSIYAVITTAIIGYIIFLGFYINHFFNII